MVNDSHDYCVFFQEILKKTRCHHFQQNQEVICSFISAWCDDRCYWWFFVYATSISVEKTITRYENTVLTIFQNTHCCIFLAISWFLIFLLFSLKLAFFTFVVFLQFCLIVFLGLFLFSY